MSIQLDKKILLFFAKFITNASAVAIPDSPNDSKQRGVTIVYDSNDPKMSLVNMLTGKNGQVNCLALLVGYIPVR